MTDLSPEKIEHRRQLWREGKQRHSLAKANAARHDREKREAAIEAELLTVAELLHTTVDKRPERFLGVLQESLPRLRAARQHMKPLTLAARLTDHLIAIVELMPRRSIR